MFAERTKDCTRIFTKFFVKGYCKKHGFGILYKVEVFCRILGCVTEMAAMQEFPAL